MQIADIVQAADFWAGRSWRKSPLIRTNISSGYPFEDLYGYARAVRVGDHVFVSGTTARPPCLDGEVYQQMMGGGIAPKALPENSGRPSFQRVTFSAMARRRSGYQAVNLMAPTSARTVMTIPKRGGSSGA